MSVAGPEGLCWPRRCRISATSKLRATQDTRADRAAEERLAPSKRTGSEEQAEWTVAEPVPASPAASARSLFSHFLSLLPPFGDSFSYFLAGDDPTPNSTPRSRGSAADVESDFHHTLPALDMAAHLREGVRRDTENCPTELTKGAKVEEEEEGEEEAEEEEEEEEEEELLL